MKPREKGCRIRKWQGHSNLVDVVGHMIFQNDGFRVNGLYCNTYYTLFSSSLKKKKKKVMQKYTKLA